MIEETPWLRDALAETEQRKSIALLLDENRINDQSSSYLRKISMAQSSNGGFPWFSGGVENTYITQYVVGSFARMKEMGISRVESKHVDEMINKALKFMDEEIQYRYNRLKEKVLKSGGDLNADHITQLDIQYLYVRSFYSDIQSQEVSEEVQSYYLDQAMKYWTTKSDMTKAMIGSIALRNELINTSDLILQSFKERAIESDQGLYWKQALGYFWYQLPIETHTAITRFFVEAGSEEELVNKMKLWLLNQKRTQSWPTTKSTSDAIYTLLMTGEDSGEWLDGQKEPTIIVNDDAVDMQSEPGTGYVKKSWLGADSEIVESISIRNNNNNVGWGGIYIQYLEEIDKVKHSGDGHISIQKQVFKKIETGNQSRLVILEDGTVNVGDVLVNRLVISVDRDLEFVHLKDMRPTGTEPMNVLSGYRWKSGLGYFESTRDAGTHFFIDYLPKGNYVFEYTTRVSHAGVFDGGVATLSCMYAPEFTSNSMSEKLHIN